MNEPVKTDFSAMRQHVAIGAVVIIGISAIVVRRWRQKAMKSSTVRVMGATDSSTCCSNDAPETAASSAVNEQIIFKPLLTHETSVAMVPSDDAWLHIQSARRLVEDKGLWRWPPHANLLYPFVAPSLFESAACELARAAASVEPFSCTLRDFGVFVHKRSATLWLRPDTSRDGALHDLQYALQRAMPLCDAQRSQHGGDFTPHVTVGHFADEASALAARDRILTAAFWPREEGIRFLVTHVVVMARTGKDGGQFEPKWWVPLGGGATSVEGDHGDRHGRMASRAAMGERFAHMPSEMPPFCAKVPKKQRRAR